MSAPFVTQLREGGVTALFSSGDGTNDPEFVKQAGESSKEAILTCPCIPAPDALAEQYEALVAEHGDRGIEGPRLVTRRLACLGWRKENCAQDQEREGGDAGGAGFHHGLLAVPVKRLRPRTA